MKHRKSCIAILLCAVMIFGTAGCSNTQDTDAKTQTESKEEQKDTEQEKKENPDKEVKRKIRRPTRRKRRDERGDRDAGRRERGSEERCRCAGIAGRERPGTDRAGVYLCSR
ncbi:MAG: hypothetical protein ACLRMZ_22485 [Blautia marasmi]